MAGLEACGVPGSPDAGPEKRKRLNGIELSGRKAHGSGGAGPGMQADRLENAEWMARGGAARRLAASRPLSRVLDYERRRMPSFPLEQARDWPGAAADLDPSGGPVGRLAGSRALSLSLGEAPDVVLD